MRPLTEDDRIAELARLSAVSEALNVHLANAKELLIGGVSL